MWFSHKKILMLLLVILVNTVLLGVMIGYSKKKIPVYNDDIKISSEQVRVTEIYNVEDYLRFADSVNCDNTYAYCKVTLYTDLDFSGYTDLVAVGDMGEESEAATFMGTFEGNGHTISGLHMNHTDGVAALFASLGGIVKNLQIQDSSFRGNICGAVAAENMEGAILNCRVEAEVEGVIAGTIVGANRGNIQNCVASGQFVGEEQYGIIDQCYLIGQEDVEALNSNLQHVSGCYGDTLFYRWEKAEDAFLSDEPMNLLENLTAHLIIAKKEFKIKGYYSENDRQWYIALPATYGEEELIIEATTSGGDYESFRRVRGEDTIIFTKGEYLYPINFISADNVDSLYITLQDGKSLEYVFANKTEEIPGLLTIVNSDGSIDYEPVKGFYGHGNSSWEAAKKSFNLKFDSYVDLLGMGENDDFALLAGYRMNSLMSYCATTELVREVGFAFAPEYRLVNLFVDGEYAGIYFLTEKIEIDKNRLEIGSVYEETKKVNKKPLENYEYIMWLDEETQEKRYYYDIPVNPEDITGGYLLELDVADYDPNVSRFITKGRKNKVTLKRAKCSTEAQVRYISAFWQEFEDALLSEDGINQMGKRYTEYIDLESFVMQWIYYELSQEDSMKSSVYYYKESDRLGDGLIHACYPWDLERSYIMLDRLEEFWNVDVKGDYWAAFYQHEDFREEVRRVWREKYIPAIDLMIAEKPIETESGFKNLSWLKNSIGEIDRIENSRWKTAHMCEKCDTIKEVLSVRKEVLTSIFEGDYLPKY